MTELLEFKEFCSDDYETFQGVEVDDHPRIAEVDGMLDGEPVTFVIIATDYSMYVIVYKLEGTVQDHIGEFIKLTNNRRNEQVPYKAVSYAMLFDWQNIQRGHMENIGFEYID
jgi:hypothetical protein